MELRELRDFLNSLPEQFDEYGVVNGEVGVLEGSGEEGQEDLVYRCDKPIISVYVDEHSKEVCFFHQTQEDVNAIYKEDNEEEETDNGTT